MVFLREQDKMAYLVTPDYVKLVGEIVKLGHKTREHQMKWDLEGICIQCRSQGGEQLAFQY